MGERIVFFARDSFPTEIKIIVFRSPNMLLEFRYSDHIRNGVACTKIAVRASQIVLPVPEADLLAA